MKFDDILVHIGEFGFYQKRLYFILCIPIITTAAHGLVMVFINGLPEHRCAIPDLDNDTYAVQDFWHQWMINMTIPTDGSEYSKCHIYNTSEEVVSLAADPHNQSQISCGKWVYDRTTFQTTTTEQMSLVCDNLIKRSHLNMLTGLGAAFGAITLGTASDIFGRKKVLYISLVTQLVVGVATVWSPEYISLCVSRFLQAVSGSGIFLSAFTMGVELVAPSKRIWTGMIIDVVWVNGLLILAGMAYLIRNWQYLQLAISLPAVLSLSFWWIIPESPRWLLANGRTAEAHAIIQRAAEVNKVKLPEGLLENKIENDDDHLPQIKLWKLCAQRTLAVRSLVIFFNWCVVSLVYYGLTLNSAYLYGGVHLNFFLSTVVESVAYVLCFLLLDRIGRKALHISTMLVGGIACCCTIFTVLYLPEEYQVVTTTLAMVGKLGSSAAYAIIYIYSSELFPTVIRSGALGVSSMFAEVGGIVAAYIADLGQLVPGSFGVALPLMVFGGTSVIAGLASLVLPETLNKTLPETMEDAIKFGKQTSGHNDSNTKTNNVVGMSVKKLDGYDNYSPNVMENM